MKLLNKLKHIIFLFLICLSLFGCGSKETVTIGRDSVIVAFGDSLTQGVGVSISESYPSQLEILLGVKVVNSGISGQTSQQGLARINTVLNESMPDVVIICYGGNDVLQRKSKSELTNNLRQMILAAKQKGIEVILVAVPDFGLRLSPMNLYRQLASAHDVVLIEDTLGDLLSNSSMKSDRVHLNEKGYKALATKLAEHITIIE
ncbi:arylesterase [Pseudoalteromonas sp. G4]|uniref:arylesterase n=1 Tax=Pseudoalteromonas sp. G4 TaxID=2992761 RepID=UPI00237D4B82|nr:arylesterase [Pseudoalteromonas sp. G4]MDE3271901.1 arylesterase [Pseudoalteromonas sp. G4]